MLAAPRSKDRSNTAETYETVPMFGSAKHGGGFSDGS